MEDTNRTFIEQIHDLIGLEKELETIGNESLRKLITKTVTIWSESLTKQIESVAK